jgi:DNA-binding NtrC family response regulator
MEPFDVSSVSGSQFENLPPDLDSDVKCAAAVGLPVLISADLPVAEWVARLIHERAGGHSAPFVVFRPGRKEDVGRLKEHLANGSGRGGGTLFIADVARATRDLQALLCDYLGEGHPNSRTPFRIVAATSERLFDLTQSGEFDELLFYRLNKIHIRIHQRDDVARSEDDAAEEGSGQARDMLDVAAFRRHRAALRGLKTRRETPAVTPTG